MTNVTDLSSAKIDIFWARMPGFAPWPARRCSAFEESMLRNVQSTKLVNPTAVSFLGLKKERAWIAKANIIPLDAETWSSKFDKKKFKADRDYRAAVSEALRLTGIKLDDETATSIFEASKEFGEQLHSCCVCSGSVHSGSIISCTECGLNCIHWHCFRPADPEVVKKKWVCDSCCEEKRFHANYTTDNADFGAVENGMRMDIDESATHPSTLDSNDMKTPSSKPPRSRSGTGNKSSRTEMDSMARTVLSAVNRQSAIKIEGNKNVGNSQDAVIRRSSLNNTKKIVETVETTHQPSTTATTASSEEPANDFESNKLASEDVDDNCFICGEAGEVLLCDYPMCRKVYHQVCVLKVFPTPNTFDLSHQQVAYNNEWWCPRHFCLDCGAIETLPVSLYSVPLPQVLYEVVASRRRSQSTMTSSSGGGLGSIQQADLHACASCPFALCQRCDDSCSKLAAPLLPVELCTETSTSLFQKTSLRSLPGQRSKPLPRALSSLLNGSDDTTPKASTSDTHPRSENGRRSLQASELCCKFCLVSHLITGETHILDSQLEVLLPANHNVLSQSNSNAANNGQGGNYRKGIKSLAKRIPSEFRQLWQISRMLEVAWVKMTNTRLSLPFLRPLLPLPPDILESSSSAAKEMTSTAATDHSNMDMMYLLEKIHALRYQSFADFLNDVAAIRRQVEQKLSAAFHSHAKKHLLMALDTIEFAGAAFLRRQESRVWSERQLAASTSLPSSGNHRDDGVIHGNAISGGANMEVADVEGTSSSRKRRAATLSSSSSLSTDAMMMADAEDPSDSNFTDDHASAGTLNWLLQLLPLCSRLACHIQPVTRPGVLTALLSSVRVLQQQQEEGSAVLVFDRSMSNQLSELIVNSPFEAAATALVIPRSVAAWTEHLLTGDARTQFYDDDTTAAVVGTWEEHSGEDASCSVSSSRALRPKNYLDMPAIAAAQNTVRKLLSCEEEDVFDASLPRHAHDFQNFQQMMDYDLDVVESILSMKKSLAREDVTLPYPHENTGSILSNAMHPTRQPSDGDLSVMSLDPARQSAYQRHVSQQPVLDDTEIILHRMEEMTQQLYSLQQRFRYVHDTKRQQHLFVGGSAMPSESHGVISIGEIGIVAELKLANDNLRWKLQQRDALLESTTRQLAVLQRQVAEQSQQIEELKKI